MYWKNWNDLPNTVCNVIVNWGIRATVKASAHQNVIRVHHRTPERHMSRHKGLLSTCRRFKQVMYSITDKTGRVGQCCVRMEESGRRRFAPNKVYSCVFLSQSKDPSVSLQKHRKAVFLGSAASEFSKSESQCERSQRKSHTQCLSGSVCVGLYCFRLHQYFNFFHIFL